MGKTKRRAAPVTAGVNEPTAERMRHGVSVPVVPPKIADEPRTTMRVREFKTTRVDLMYHLGSLTWAQWYAGNWWRTQVEAGLGLPRVVADYGQSNGGGSRDPSPLPLSDKAENARRLLAAAKAALSIADRMAVEDALDDPHPTLVGREASARCGRWRAGLQALAVYLKVAG